MVAYERFKGDMDAIYETVMLSNVLEDEERFRTILDEAIASKDVSEYKKYTKESKKSKEARIKAARDEGNEAEEYAKELGVHDKLFGGSNGKKGKSKKPSEADLLALIHGNQRSRQQNQNDFLDNIAAKYAAPAKKSGKGKKRIVEEDDISEEAFQAASARLKKKGKK